MPTLLFLGADPSSSTRLALDRETREITHRLRAAPRGGALEVRQEWAVRVGDLQACLLRHEPEIVHFSGQGSAAGQLLVEDEARRVVPIAREALAGLFAILGSAIRCVVLHACYSLEQAGAIARHVDCVIGLGAAMDSEAAIVWSGAFYQALGFGKSVEMAVALAANALSLHGFSDARAPELLLREGVTASGVRLGAAGPPFFVPFSRNPGFVGRAVDLAKLHGLLQKGEAVGVRPAMLTGMGGIGKTQLAVEYVHAHRAAYAGGVYWVNAAADWQSELARLAIDVGCSAGDAPESERWRRLSLAFAQYLRERPEALLVFDNVEDPRTLRGAGLGFIPSELGCRLLFTTRRRDAGKHFTSVEVSVLPAEAACALLLSERSAGGERESEAARGICRRLGYLPLALALASAFLGQHPEIGIGAYRERLAEEGCLAAVDEAGVEALDLATQHEAAVGATLRLQWEALKSEAARRVLQTAALLGEAEQVPRARLSLLTGLSDRAEKGRPAPLGEALRAASQLWLVEELTAEDVRLHPLVREFVAGTIEGRAVFAEACAERMGEALWEMRWLQEEVAGRGIDAVLADLRAGEALAPEGRIAGLIRPLDLESHAMRKWESEPEPGFFLQQLRNCCMELGSGELRTLAEAELTRMKWPWLRERVPTSRASEALVRTLEGHTSGVNGVAVTVDGRFTISASEDKTLKVWDLTTGQSIRTLEGHTSGVIGVAVTADGRFAVSTTRNGKLKVWDLDAGQAIHTDECATENVIGVVVTASRRITPVSRSISWSLLKATEPLDLTTGQSITIEDWFSDLSSVAATEYGHIATDLVYGMAVTADGRFAVSTSRERTLKVWNLATGQMVRSLEGHTGDVNGVAVTADGRFAVSASGDRTLKVWNLATGQTVRRLEGHTRGVNGVAVTADGPFAVSASGDRTLKVWNLATGQTVRSLEGHTGDVNGVAVTTDGRFAVSASEDRTLKVWDLATGQTIQSLEGHTSGVNGVVVTADGRFAVSASWDKTLKVWDLTIGQVIRTLKGHTDGVIGVAMTADGRLAVSASLDRTLKIWDLTTNQAARTLNGYTDGVIGVAVTADGRFAVSTSLKKSLTVWNLTTGHALLTLEGHADRVRGVAVTGDGRFAVSASEDKALKVWDLASGQTVSTRTTGAPLTCCALTADGRTIIVGDDMGAVHFLDWVKPHA